MKLNEKMKEWMRLKLRGDYGGSIEAENGTWYSTLTGQGSAHIEVDWEKLDKEIDEFCKTFEKE